MRYDPDSPIDPAEWSALGEMEQQLIVERYHKHAHVRLLSPRMHAIMHAAIETQVAQGRTALSEHLSA